MTNRIRLCAAADLAEGGMLQIRIAGFDPFAVYRVNGSVYVTEDTCSHGKASLADEGELAGYVITCSWHDGQFDVRTGEALAMPCTKAIKAFPVSIENDAIWIDVE